MYSMTGYGRAEYKADGINLIVEVKTVNNRNLDINCKTPRSFIMFEDLLRKCVQSKLKRGRVDVFVNFSDTREKPKNLTVDYALAEGYVNASKNLCEKFDIINDYSVSSLMRVSDVIKEENIFDDCSEFEEVLSQTTLNALDVLNSMRKTEGAKLIADMKERMVTVSETVEKISSRAPVVKEEYAQKLKLRIEESLNGVNYDEARLLNEVAFFADKSNIDEEITRLRSHISQFYKLIEKEGAGKQVDFLIQEFNREANTICSKANDIEVTNYGLTLKCEIEKIREQIQNIE